MMDWMDECAQGEQVYLIFLLFWLGFEVRSR